MWYQSVFHWEISRKFYTSFENLIWDFSQIFHTDLIKVLNQINFENYHTVLFFFPRWYTQYTLIDYSNYVTSCKYSHKLWNSHFRRAFFQNEIQWFTYYFLCDFSRRNIEIDFLSVGLLAKSFILVRVCSFSFSCNLSFGWYRTYKCKQHFQQASQRCYHWKNQ